MAIVGAITNSLKALGKRAGERAESHRATDCKTLIPGLLGSIVSFIFKTAGQAIGFLTERAWLLVVAVVAFVMERYIKKNR